MIGQLGRRQSLRIKNRLELQQKAEGKNMIVENTASSLQPQIQNLNEISTIPPVSDFLELNAHILPQKSVSSTQISDGSIISQNCTLMVEEEQVPEKRLEVAQYEKEIFQHLLRSQKMRKIPAYFQYLKGFDQQLRSSAVNWLVSVQKRLNLRNQTLFNAVYLLDLHLAATHQMTEDQLKVSALTCLYISSKYSQVVPPNLKQFAKFARPKEIIQTQSHILRDVNFNLLIISPLIILEHKCQTQNISEEIKLFAQFLLELCLVEYHMLRFAPSQQVTCALYLAGAIKNCPISRKFLEEQLNSNANEFQLGINWMFGIYKNMSSNKYSEILEKYTSILNSS